MNHSQKIAAIIEALHINEHYLVVQPPMWFIRHPLACREIPKTCWATAYVQTLPQPLAGTYRMVPVPGWPEKFVADLELVPDGTDTMMERLRQLKVWP